nr:hypothetical protein [uncultured Cohaesibacter sp.]
MAARSSVKSKSKDAVADSKTDATIDGPAKSEVSAAEGIEASNDAGASNDDMSAELDARQAELEKREAAIVEKEAELALCFEALDARKAELEEQNAPAASATISFGDTERHRFEVLKPCRFKGKRRPTGEAVDLTKEEHEDLFAIGAVTDDWEDGIAFQDS